MKTDSLIKYYVKKLSTELNCESLRLDYSDKKLFITALKGEKVVKTYEVVDNQKFQHPRKCIFVQDGTEIRFGSINEASRWFGVGRTLLQYYIQKGYFFYARRGGESVKFLRWEEDE